MAESNQEAYARWMKHQEEVTKWIENNEKAKAARLQVERAAQQAQVQQNQPPLNTQPQFQIHYTFGTAALKANGRIEKLLELAKTTTTLATNIEDSYHLARVYQETLARETLGAADINGLNTFFGAMAGPIMKTHHIILRYGRLAMFDAQHSKGFPTADEEENHFVIEWKNVAAGYDLVKLAEGVLIAVMDRGDIREQAAANAWARYAQEIQKFSARLGRFNAESLGMYR
ncbi:hypothetical protein MMYC01_204621 [Madurella mycetomatis]|uniref:Uncharacterized protein n=1 Tax=Madurella mycetomatis TaxID=100816 RepID=A0A175W9Z0_9PEZI|nr:hypothetical protein MMYC01_204621 [Madurella mycetomatis]